MNAFPTLLIGIGPSGNILLRCFKNNLADTGDASGTSPVKLLWIGAPASIPEDRYPGKDLEPAECIHLDSDLFFHQLDARDPEFRKRFAWWVENQQSDILHRSAGRMAYYWSKQFQANPQWNERFNSCKAALLEPPDDKFRIWIAASLAEVESGLLFDLAWEMRFSALINRVSEISLFLLLDGISNQGYPTSEERLTGMRYGAIRELNRAMSGKKQLIDHGMNEATLIDRILFDRIYLYDQPNAYIALPDQWLALLERAVTNRVAQIRQPVGNFAAGQLIFSTIKNQTYLVPVKEIHHLCAARLELDSLFAAPSASFKFRGLFPGRRQDLPRLGDLETRKLLTDSMDDLPRQTVDAFRALINAADSRWVAHHPADLPTGIESAFQDRLIRYLTREMTERDREYPGEPAFNAISWANAFLKKLYTLLENCEYVLLQKKQRDSLAALLHEALPVFKIEVRNCQAEIQEWSEFIFTRLYDRLQNDVQDARQQLELLQRHNSTRIIVAGENREAQTPEEDIYLEKMGLRVGEIAFEETKSSLSWLWQKDNTGHSRLNWIFTGEDAQVTLHAREDLQRGEFITLWRKAAHRRTQLFVNQLNICEQLQTTNRQFGEQSLIPLLEMRPVIGLERASEIFLIGKRTPQLEEWARSAGISGAGQNLIDIEDDSRVTLLCLDANLTVDYSRCLFKDQNDFRSHPRWQIFLQEQYASEIESEIERLRRRYPRGWGNWNPLFERNYRFAPDFVRFMFDRVAFQRLMRMLFFNCIQCRQNELGQPQWQITTGRPDQEPIRIDQAAGSSLEDVLDAIIFKHYFDYSNNAHPLFQGTFQATIQRIDRELDDIWHSRPEFRETICQNIEQRIQIWETMDTFHQNLAVYQKFLYLKTILP